MPLRGGGVGRLMANAILNFHFDYLHTSLSDDGEFDDGGDDYGCSTIRMGEDRQNSRSVKMALMILMVVRWVKSNLHRKRPIEFEVRLLQKLPNKEYKCRQQILIFFLLTQRAVRTWGQKEVGSRKQKKRKRLRRGQKAGRRPYYDALSGQKVLVMMNCDKRGK